MQSVNRPENLFELMQLPSVPWTWNQGGRGSHCQTSAAHPLDLDNELQVPDSAVVGMLAPLLHDDLGVASGLMPLGIEPDLQPHTSGLDKGLVRQDLPDAILQRDMAVMVELLKLAPVRSTA